MELSFSSEQCAKIGEALHYEWVETDGGGAYASSTLLECHTRKYHGLLVVPVPELGSKFVLLSKVETVLLINGKPVELSTNQYPGTFYPRGYQQVHSAYYGNYPSVMYESGEVLLRRAVMMVRGQPTILIRYDLVQADGPVQVRLLPLVAGRDMHWLTKANPHLTATVRSVGGCARFQPYPNLPPLYFDGSSPYRWRANGNWFRNLEYQREADRGFDYHEDLFCPGAIEVQLEPGTPFVLRVSTQPPAGGAQECWEQEETRRLAAVPRKSPDPESMRMLKAHSEAFLITNARGLPSVVAGYPWFAEWGRDTMIALPGLTLYAGRPAAALPVLKTYLGLQKDGLIPNFLGTNAAGDAYNSVDASLWCFWTTQQYLLRTGDRDGVLTNAFEPLGAILAAFAGGRAPNVRLQPDGLISVGNAHTQLTWMDAKVNGEPVTPRHGLAIELNALWYNALRFYLELAKLARKRLDRSWDDLATACGAALPARFFLPGANYLADVVNDAGVDGAVRPNQILAVSLPYSALTPDQMLGVVERVRKELATPYGLRTLAPGSPAYQRYYGGSSAQRDGAYHQGLVWPWLVGPYVEASLRVAADKKAEAKVLRKFLAPLFTTHLREYGLFSVAEILEPEPPYRPDGCIAQAWSVGEVIRAHELLQEA